MKIDDRFANPGGVRLQREGECGIAENRMSIGEVFTDAATAVARRLRTQCANFPIVTVSCERKPTAGRKALPRMTVKEGLTTHPFDVENGVRTSGLIPGRFLKTGHAHDRHSTAYFGVAPSVFRH